MKAQVTNSEGKPSGEVSLPVAFDEPIRADLIQRAALSDMSYGFQPKGNDIWAGMETSARYRGRKEDFGSIKNMGISRLPREVLSNGRFGKVKRVPSAVKGRRAHPPHVEKRLVEFMNKKEYAKALRSAIAATADVKSVQARGHKISDAMKLPIVLDDSVEKIAKTKQMVVALNAMGIGNDIGRAQSVHRRTGVGSRKGGGKRARSILVVVGEKCPMAKAARNIAGVDVIEAKKLRVIDLAPGAKGGRLAAFTKSALEAIGARKD